MKRPFKVQLDCHKSCGTFAKKKDAIQRAREVAKRERNNVEVLDMDELKFVFTTGSDELEILYLPGRRVVGRNLDLSILKE